MERLYIWLAMTTMYLSITVTVAQGGCRGKWAIHACLGGNGKRSSSNSAALENSILFKRLEELKSYRDTLEQLEKSQQHVIPRTTMARSDLVTSEDRIQNLLHAMALTQKSDYPINQLSTFEDVNTDEW